MSTCLLMNKIQLTGIIVFTHFMYDMVCMIWQDRSKGFLAGKLYECDIILIMHERLEYELMNRYKYYYDEAHRITERKYNYSKAVNLNGKNRPDKVDR